MKTATIEKTAIIGIQHNASLFYTWTTPVSFSGIIPFVCNLFTFASCSPTTHHRVTWHAWALRHVCIV